MFFGPAEIKMQNEKRCVENKAAAAAAAAAAATNIYSYKIENYKNSHVSVQIHSVHRKYILEGNCCFKDLFILGLAINMNFILIGD